MQVDRLGIPHVVLCTPKVFTDSRGWFFEAFNESAFGKYVSEGHHFVQDNHSRSAKGVVRGLHYQCSPHAQGKAVRVVRGAIFDVAVDIRRSSPTFGKWIGVELTEESHSYLWIPPGFAHGFMALTDGAEVLYKTTAPWAPECERAILWNDPQLAIAWPHAAHVIVADKDSNAPPLARARDLFP